MAEGKVWLVGAGPGDPGLITVAGLQRLSEADVVVYDRLVSPKLLGHARTDAELIFAGKAVGDRALEQNEINALLVAKAKEGKSVVRLKGGDPFVFGRGGEEAEALVAAGVPFGVVPGVTSAIAAPAYAGIPLTHRDHASSFLVATGHENPAKPESAIEWQKLTTAADTLVFMMGTQNLPDIVGRLVIHGRPEDTPAAVVRWGTTPEQRTVVGTLVDIADKVKSAGLTPPAVLVVGDVVRLEERLRWYGLGPLFGKRVLVTRARHQASALVGSLAEEGAEVIELPAIEIQPTADKDEVERAISGLSLGEYAWVVFTSTNGVDLFFEHLHERGQDARVFHNVKVAAIGSATAEELDRRGIRADLVPAEYIAEELAAALTERVAAGQKVLLPRAQNARPELIEGLRAVGAQVDEVMLYVAATPREIDAEALARVKRGDVDVVTFASSSTVRNLVQLLDGNIVPLKHTVVACIGPITADTAREHGFRVDIVAEEHTVAGLVRSLQEWSGRGR